MHPTTVAITFLIFSLSRAANAQSSGDAPSSVTMKQLMLDVIHPASNDILLITARGPREARDWATLRRGAATLVASGEMLVARGRFINQAMQPEWNKQAKALADAGSAAYKAALAKDAKALAEPAASMDAACTACHKQYRPNVFPPVGPTDATGPYPTRPDATRTP